VAKCRHLSPLAKALSLKPWDEPTHKKAVSKMLVRNSLHNSFLLAYFLIAFSVEIKISSTYFRKNIKNALRFSFRLFFTFFRKKAYKMFQQLSVNFFSTIIGRKLCENTVKNEQ
jgi:hypothetical protein